MLFPNHPTCHLGRDHAGQYTPRWEARTDQHNGTEPFRRCTFCGSIHPQDLLRVLSEGAILEGADWKYGWPHKFYVERIPNPTAGQEGWHWGSQWRTEPVGYKPTELEIAHGATVELVQTQQGQRLGVNIPTLGKAPEWLHAKWYNEHLQDAGYDLEGFEAVAAAIRERTGLEFSIAGGYLKYRRYVAARPLAVDNAGK